MSCSFLFACWFSLFLILFLSFACLLFFSPMFCLFIILLDDFVHSFFLAFYLLIKLFIFLLFIDLYLLVVVVCRFLFFPLLIGFFVRQILWIIECKIEPKKKSLGGILMSFRILQLAHGNNGKKYHINQWNKSSTDVRRATIRARLIDTWRAMKGLVAPARKEDQHEKNNKSNVKKTT